MSFFPKSSSPEFFPDPDHLDGRRPAVFALGSNVGDSERHLVRALGALAERFGPLRIASPYRSAPVSPIAQDDFLNTVAAVSLPPESSSLETALRSTLAFAKSLEREAGRRDGPKDGPRPLDVDLLLWGEHRASFGPLDEPAGEDRWPGPVEVPHPRMRRRRFVLDPLVEILPDLELPTGERAVDLLAETLDQRVVRGSWRKPFRSR